MVANKVELSEETKLVQKLKNQVQHTKELSAKHAAEADALEKQNQELGKQIAEAKQQLNEAILEGKGVPVTPRPSTVKQKAVALQEQVDAQMNELVVQNGFITLLQQCLAQSSKSPKGDEVEKARARVAALESELRKKDLEVQIAFEKERLLRDELRSSEAAIDSLRETLKTSRHSS